MYYAKEFIITSLNFIIFVLISFFIGVPSAFSSEASLRPIDRDSKTRLRTIPISENIIPQQLTQNQSENSNDEKMQTDPCPSKTSKSEEKELSTPQLSDQKIQIIGRTVLGEENAIVSLEDFIKKINGSDVTKLTTNANSGIDTTESDNISEDPIVVLKSFIDKNRKRTVTQEELEAVGSEITDAITQLYLNEGFLTSRATSVEVEDEIVRIKVLEGQLEEIKITRKVGNNRPNLRYICSRVNLGVNVPLNLAKLEDQLRLLRANPLFENIEATLRSPEQEDKSELNQQGKSILVVTVTEAFPFEANFGIDNYSTPSIGGERINLNLLHRNLTGIGDELSVSYRPRIQTIDGTYRLDFAYQAPLNAMNGTLQFNASVNRNEVVEGDFDNLGIRGEVERYKISYRQPLIRNSRQELALSLGFVYRDGQTFLFQDGFPFGIGPEEDGVSRTSVFELGQEYTMRDVAGAWAFRSQLRFGTDLFDATRNSSPIPDGQFLSWLAQVQRVQVLNDDNVLIIQGDIQLTPDSLLPSEQFVIGGGQSVRGYRQNLRSGDNGFRFSIEDRITLVRDEGADPVFILAPFFDMGSVWNISDNPNQIAEQRFIAGLGLGLLWEPIKGLNLRLDYAPPLIDLDDRGNNVQDDGFYFSINYRPKFSSKKDKSQEKSKAEDDENEAEQTIEPESTIK